MVKKHKVAATDATNCEFDSYCEIRNEIKYDKKLKMYYVHYLTLITSYSAALSSAIIITECLNFNKT